MSEIDERLGQALAAARERAGFSQDEVALLLGQQRPVISNWEHGARRPNDQQLSKLSAIYRVPLDVLLGAEETPRVDFERLMFRDAGDRLDPTGKFEIQRFLTFLDEYGALLDALGEAPGMTEPPFSLREGFGSKEDVRRKAENARRFFGLGGGPVGDLAGLSDLVGITVYSAPLGADLKGTVSGAFVPHHRVGFSILVNAETTLGRRQFTLAHELGHALFHGDNVYVGYHGRREASERFANSFAAEFLVPTQSLRAAVESQGLTKVRDPEVVVHLHRMFGVSYAMMLYRLGASNLAAPEDIDRLQSVHPVHMAERLGYEIEADEWGQHPDRLRLGRFPRRFLRVVRRALAEERITVSGTAQIMGLAEEDVEEFLSERPSAAPEAEEFEYLSTSA